MVERLDFQDVARHLAVLDFLCKKENVYAKFVIFGGASLLIHLGENKFRKTLDIDYNILAVSDEEKLQKILNQLRGVFQPLGGFPMYPDKEMYLEDGTLLEKLGGVEFSNIRIFLPSIEMIALSKLMTRRPKDYHDLKETELLDRCDLEKLKRLADECVSYMTDHEYKNSNYYDWDELLKQRGLSLTKQNDERN